eukprot:m.28648 g.28648  ORF g.28648 m.28648 type:complete len:79 (-) comp13623_c0_seq2:1153-1389(-)
MNFVAFAEACYDLGGLATHDDFDRADVAGKGNLSFVRVQEPQAYLCTGRLLCACFKSNLNADDVGLYSLTRLWYIAKE